MEQEREGFIKNSKMALWGTINGIFGSLLYETIILIILSNVIGIMVSRSNSGLTEVQFQEMVEAKYSSIPTALISCLISFITLVVFVFIIKFDNFKRICKRIIDLKAVKYGAIAVFAIVFVSIVYNFFAINLLDWNENGNANQQGVELMIKNSPIFGFVLVVLLAPLSEELTYRYCLFGGLRKKSKWVAYLVSGFVFMAMHGISSLGAAGGFNIQFLKELVFLPPYLFSGLVLCYIYDKTDNIGSSFICHLLNNLISFISVVL